MLFGWLRWLEKHRRWMRVLDYVLAVLCIGWGLWQRDGLAYILGGAFLLAAILNLNEKLNLFLPRIQKKGGRPDV